MSPKSHICVKVNDKTSSSASDGLSIKLDTLTAFLLFRLFNIDGKKQNACWCFYFCVSGRKSEGQTTSRTVACSTAGRRALIKSMQKKRVTCIKRVRRAVKGAVPSGTFSKNTNSARSADRIFVSQLLIGAAAQRVAGCTDSNRKSVAL